jgi:adenylate cyclase
VGVGVHTGTAYVGTASGAEGSISDVTALGESVNVAARLSSAAAAGEALVSDAAWTASRMEDDVAVHRDIELRGISGLVGVRVLRS